MKLHCPDCGSPIPADDINLQTMAAKCAQCDSVFSFADAVTSRTRLPAESAGPLRSVLTQGLLPRTRVKVEEFAGTLRLSWRWFRLQHIFLIFFCIAWDSFLVFWYTMAFSSRGVPWLMIVFPIAHVAVGVGLTYFTLAGLLNRTTIDVTNMEMVVRHFPLPWLGNRRIPSDAIAQLHCEQNISRGKNGSSMITYSLFATLKDGTKLKLAGGFEDIAEARTVEQQVEKFLRLADRAVVGEYRGA